MKPPPSPKWDNTTGDLNFGDLRRRAEDHERSLLPQDIVFPRTGQIWEAVRDCQVDVRKWMLAPKGAVLADAELQKGEKVRILELDDPRPLAIIFQPVRYKELQQYIAPGSLRYVLWLRTVRVFPGPGYETGYFTELFRLAEDVF